MSKLHTEKNGLKIPKSQLQPYSGTSKSRPGDQTKLVFNPKKKVRQGFLLFFMFMFPELNETNF